MLARDFLRTVREAMPSNAELEEWGLNLEEVSSIQATFKSTVREPQPRDSATGSELERMITLYDCSTVEVGLVRFLPQPLPHAQGVQIAYCEADPVIVNDSGRVLMFYHDAPEESLEWAANSESFLEGLSVLVNMIRNKSSWRGRNEEAAKLFAERTGGRDSITCFKILWLFP